jgi:hypothetical protein
MVFYRRSVRLMILLDIGKPSRLLTITCRHCGNENQAADEMYKEWYRVARVLRCKYDKKLAYLGVFECHKDGWPHLHVALRSSYIRVDAIRWVMKSLGVTCGINIRSWVPKHLFYLSKDPVKLHGHKRFFSSRNWCLPGNEALLRIARSC